MRDPGSRDRSKGDEPEVSEGVTPDLATIHAVGHGEPMPDATLSTDTLDWPVETPDAPAAPEPPDRDADVAAALNMVIAELSRIKAAYGEDTARIIGERALVTIRRT